MMIDRYDTRIIVQQQYRSIQMGVVKPDPILLMVIYCLEREKKSSTQPFSSEENLSKIGIAYKR
jgi:hypothetical protein